MQPLTDTMDKTAARAASAATDAAEDGRERVPYPPLYQSMMVVGLLGSVYGRHDDAEIVHVALAPTLTDPLNYRINRALAQGMGGRAKEAVAALRAHLDAFPQDDATKVVLAVTLMFAGDSQWTGVMENVLASSADPAAREAAMRVVGYLHSLNP